MQVIFSCENTQYMRWQAEFLHFTYTRTGMQSQLTALVSATDEPSGGFTCETFGVGNYKDCVAAETYTPLNKPGGICEWAAQEGPREETVFMVDPDSAFVRAVEDPGPLRRGEAYADAHDYMHPELPFNQMVLQRHCAPEFRKWVQPVGIYVLTRRDDLAALAPRWLQKAIDIKSDRLCTDGIPYAGWISEMLGYSIAAAESGIRHDISQLAQTTGSGSLQSPVIHYCFPLNASGRCWQSDQEEPILWSKWGYRPWEHPPVADAATVESRELLLRLAELAAANRARGQNISKRRGLRS